MLADREKLIELLEQVQDEGAIVIPTGQSDRIELVKNQKVADHLIANGVTVRERGRWIIPKIPSITLVGICSECGKMGDRNYNFCPNCGADMR